MSNIEIVYIKKFQHKEYIEDIAEIIFEAIKAKYLGAFHGSINEVKEVILDMVKKGLIPLSDSFLAIDRNEKKVVGMLLILGNKKPPIYRLIMHKLRLHIKIGNKKVNDISKVINIIDKENKRFKDSKSITFINLIAVKEEYRRKGIGKSIMNFAIDNIKSRCDCVGSDCNCKINLMCTSKGFLKEFYASFGFKVLLEVEHREMSTIIGKGYGKLIHMSKYL